MALVLLGAEGRQQFYAEVFWLRLQEEEEVGVIFTALEPLLALQVPLTKLVNLAVAPRRVVQVVHRGQPGTLDVNFLGQMEHMMVEIAVPGV